MEEMGQKTCEVYKCEVVLIVVRLPVYNLTAGSRHRNLTESAAHSKVATPNVCPPVFNISIAIVQCFPLFGLLLVLPLPHAGSAVLWGVT